MHSIRLYLAQRVSAMILAPLVLLHLGVMIYAVQGGLSAEEILGRTRDSFWWGSVYGLFVLAVSVHAAIGLRVIAGEWFGLGPRKLDLLMWVVMLGLLALGGRAVYAVTLA